MLKRASRWKAHLSLIHISIATAKADPAVAAALEGKQLVKEIYVKGRLVNLAAKG